MTTMLVQGIVAFWLLLFGAMAVVPFLLDTKSTSHSARQAAEPVREDRVISIVPVAGGTKESGIQTPASILAAANARATAQASSPRTDRHAA